MKELIVATTNQGKVKEIQAMLKDLNIEVKSLKDVYDENKKLKTKELAGQIAYAGDRAGNGRTVHVHAEDVHED